MSCVFSSRPSSRTDERRFAVGRGQDGAAGEHHRSQRGRFAIAGQADGALERAEQIEQQQDRLECSFGGEELLKAETVGAEIVLEFGDAVFHVGAAVVVAPDFFFGFATLGGEDTEAVLGHVDQLAAPRIRVDQSTRRIDQGAEINEVHRYYRLDK